MKQRKDWTDRVVATMRFINHWCLTTGALYTAWWGWTAVQIIRGRPATDGLIDWHVVRLCLVWSFLGLLWLATREFFSRRERGQGTRVYADSHEEHVFLVAFAMVSHTGTMSRQDLEVELHALLPMPQGVQGGQASLDRFWVAEDDRQDDSQEDSAVFVPKGMQIHTQHILEDRGLYYWAEQSKVRR